MLAADADGFRPRETFFAMLRERFGLRDSVDDLVAEFYEVFTPTLRCEVVVADALRRVRRAGWKVAIATNGSPAQESKILETGLDRLVDGWCVSSVEGVRKPDPELLRRAAARCGEGLDGAWMVGDSAGADVAAAAAAGIRSVWLRRGRSWFEADYEPTLVADSFREAVDRILATV